jgi:hypothetical protein
MGELLQDPEQMKGDSTQQDSKSLIHITDFLPDFGIANAVVSAGETAVEAVVEAVSEVLGSS